MLTPISRFQFNKMYLYGSAAFVTGFAGVLALLVHFVPVRIADSNASNVANIQVAKKESTNVAPVAEEEEADTTNASVTPVVTAPEPTQPAVVEAPAAVETPAVPTAPVEPVVPVIPPVLDPPVIEVPIVDVSIDL